LHALKKITIKLTVSTKRERFACICENDASTPSDNVQQMEHAVFFKSASLPSWYSSVFYKEWW